MALLYGGLVLLVGVSLLFTSMLLMDRAIGRLGIFNYQDSVTFTDNSGSTRTVTPSQLSQQARHDARDYLLHTGRRCFLIAEQGEVTGLITPNEVKGIPKARWPYTTVFDVMRPLEQLRTVTPETDVSEALEIIGRDGINQLPALANGRLEGMISRDQILRYLLIRAELEM